MSNKLPDLPDGMEWSPNVVPYDPTNPIHVNAPVGKLVLEYVDDNGNTIEKSVGNDGK